MNNESLEMTKVMNLLIYITDHFHAVGDAKFYWSSRRVIVTVKEGGRTIYSTTVEIDSGSLDAQFRIIRHDLEGMVQKALVKREGCVA